MSRQVRLLQIEDSESDAELTLRLLTRAGFEVVSERVEEAEAMRRALAEKEWDIIIADYHLPGFDAPGALRILQECGLDIPCIVVSGKMGEDTAVEMMKSGAHDYVTKTNLTRLAPAVERELAEAERRRATKQAEEELSTSEECMALAVDATQLGTFDFDPRTGKILLSKYARQHFGLITEGEFTYEMFQQAVHPADREQVLRNIQESHRPESGGNYSHEYRVIGLEDGQERWLASRARVFFDSELLPVRVVGVILNITEKKRLEQHILLSQKIEGIGRLAGSLANDFNSLLTIINSYAHLFLAEIRPNEEFRDSLEELSRAATRAAGLTRQLLSFSRRQVGEPRTIVMNELVENYENMLRRLLGSNVELVLSLNPHAGAFRADFGQMGQVLINLAVNAKDAMPDGGKLTIETSSMLVDDQLARICPDVSPGQYTVLSVSDTGTGMSAEVRSHLFEPFYTTKKHGKGTGLGLSTVYGIVVNQSGGSICVKTEPGQGTTFKLLFPFIGVEATAQPAADIEALSAKGETLLLVDDVAGMREYARGLLERSGYAVLEAATGAEALATARDHPEKVQMLLTNISLPGIGGVELAEEFSAEFPGIPVLFMSDHSDLVVRHWNALGAYIQKPFTMADLLTQVRALLDRAAEPSGEPPAAK